MFPIDLRISSYKEKSEQIIRESAETLSVPDDAISNVVVANDFDKGYAEAIKQCRGYVGGYTHSDGSLGKTVPFSDETGKVRCDVVYPSSTLTALFCYSREASTYVLSRYAIAHEFGHVLDYHARSALFPPPLLGGEQSIADFSPYYTANILSEFAACFLAGRLVTGEQYEEIARNARESIEAAMPQGIRFGNQLPWYTLSQVAQVAGTAMGMVGEIKPTVIRWGGIKHNSEKELSRFSGVISDLKENWPAWDTATCVALLAERCEAFADSLRS